MSSEEVSVESAAVKSPPVAVNESQLHVAESSEGAKDGRSDDDDDADEDENITTVGEGCPDVTSEGQRTTTGLLGFLSDVGKAVLASVTSNYTNDPNHAAWQMPYNTFSAFQGKEFSSSDVAEKVFEVALPRLHTPKQGDNICTESVQEIARVLANRIASTTKSGDKTLQKKVAEAVAKNCCGKVPCEILSQWLTPRQQLRWFAEGELSALHKHIGRFITDLKVRKLPRNCSSRIVPTIWKSLQDKKISSPEAIAFLVRLKPDWPTMYELLESVAVAMFEFDLSLRYVAEMRPFFVRQATTSPPEFAPWVSCLQKIANVIDGKGLYPPGVIHDGVSYDRLREWYKAAAYVDDTHRPPAATISSALRFPLILPKALEAHHEIVGAIMTSTEGSGATPRLRMSMIYCGSENCVWDKLQLLCPLRGGGRETVDPTLLRTVSKFNGIMPSIGSLYASLTSMFPCSSGGEWWSVFPLEKILEDDMIDQWFDFAARLRFWFPMSAEPDTSVDQSYEDLIRDFQQREAIAKMYKESGKLDRQHFSRCLRAGLSKVDELLRLNPIKVRDAYELMKASTNEEMVNYVGGSPRLSHRDASTTTCAVLQWIKTTLVPLLRFDGPLRQLLTMLRFDDPKKDPLVELLWRIRDQSYLLETVPAWMEDLRGTRCLQVKEALTETTVHFLIQWFSRTELRAFVHRLTEYQVLCLPEYARQHATLGTRSDVVDHFCWLYHLTSRIPVDPSSLHELFCNVPHILDDDGSVNGLDIASSNLSVLQELVEFSSEQQLSDMEDVVNCIASQSPIVQFTLYVAPQHGDHPPLIVDSVLREHFKMTVPRGDGRRDFSWEKLESIASTARLVPNQTRPSTATSVGIAVDGRTFAEKFAAFDVKFIVMKRLLLKVLHVVYAHINWFDGDTPFVNVTHEGATISISLKNSILSVHMHFGKLSSSALSKGCLMVERLERSWSSVLATLRESSIASRMFSDAELLFVHTVMTKRTVERTAKEALRRLLFATLGRKTLDEAWFAHARRSTAEVADALNEAASHIFSTAAMNGTVPVKKSVITHGSSDLVAVTTLRSSCSQSLDLFEMILENHIATQPVSDISPEQQCAQDARSLSTHLHLLCVSEPQFQRRLDQMILLARTRTALPMSFHVVFASSSTQAAIDALTILSARLSNCPLEHQWFNYVGRSLCEVADWRAPRGCLITPFVSCEAYRSRAVNMLRVSKTLVVAGVPRSGKTHFIQRNYRPKCKSIVLGKAESVLDLCKETSVESLKHGLHIELGCGAEDFTFLLFRLLVQRRAHTGVGPVVVIEPEVPVVVEVTKNTASEKLVPRFLELFRSIDVTVLNNYFIERGTRIAAMCKEDGQRFSGASPLKHEVLVRFYDAIVERFPQLNDASNILLKRLAVQCAFALATPNAHCPLSRQCVAEMPISSHSSPVDVSPEIFFCLRNSDHTPYIAVMSEAAQERIDRLGGLPDKYQFKAYECFASHSDVRNRSVSAVRKRCIFVDDDDDLDDNPPEYLYLDSPDEGMMDDDNYGDYDISVASTRRAEPYINPHNSHDLSAPERISAFLSEVLLGATLERVKDAQITFTPQVFEAILRINTAIDFRCCPIVVVGETGCGKTYNFMTLAKIKGVSFVPFEVNMGTTAKQLQRLYRPSTSNTTDRTAAASVTTPGASRACDLLHFMDEFNTSTATDHVKRILTSSIPDRGHKAAESSPCFAGACNPFRFVAAPPGRGDAATTTTNGRLVYAVQHHLSPTIKQFAWKFEVHPTGDDLGVVRSIAEKGVVAGHAGFRESTLTSQLAEYVTEARRILDEHMKELPVSFRTIARVVRLAQEFKWIHQRVSLFPPDELERDGEELLFIRLAVAMVFYAPLPQQLLSPSGNVDGDGASVLLPRNKFQAVLPDCVAALNTSMRLFCTRIDEFISKHLIINDALRETLLVVFLSVATRTPLLLLGPPGTSKSLALFLLLKVWSASKSPLCKMPKVFPFTLQCSEHIQGSHISGVFERARAFQNKTTIATNTNSHQQQRTDHRSDALVGPSGGVEFISVVFVDEIALANNAQGQPLKVLNAWLDHEGEHDYPAVVSTSNFDIDLSLVNRCNVLRRSPLAAEELLQMLNDHNVRVAPPKDNQKRLELLSRNIAASLGVLSEAKTEQQSGRQIMKREVVGMRHVYSFISDAQFSKADESSDGKAVQVTKAVLQRMLWWHFGPAAEALEHGIIKPHSDRDKLLWEVTKRWFQEPVVRNRRCFMFSCPSFSTFRAFLVFLRTVDTGSGGHGTAATAVPVRYCFGDILRTDEDSRSSLLSDVTQAMQHRGFVVLVSCSLIYHSLLDVLNGHYEESQGTDLVRVAVDGTSFHYALHKECRIVLLSLPPNHRQRERASLASAALNDRLQHGSANMEIIVNELRAQRPAAEWNRVDALALDYGAHVEAAENIVRSVIASHSSDHVGLQQLVLGYHKGWLVDDSLSSSQQALQILRLIHTRHFWSASESVCTSIADRVHTLSALEMIQRPLPFLDAYENVVLLMPQDSDVMEGSAAGEDTTKLVGDICRYLCLFNAVTLVLSHDTPDAFATSQLALLALEVTDRPLVIVVTLNPLLVNDVGSFHLFAICQILAQNLLNTWGTPSMRAGASKQRRKVVLVAVVPKAFEIVRLDFHPSFAHMIFYGPSAHVPAVIEKACQEAETRLACSLGYSPQCARAFFDGRCISEKDSAFMSKQWELSQQPCWELLVAHHLNTEEVVFVQHDGWTHHACFSAERHARVVFRVLALEAMHRTNMRLVTLGCGHQVKEAVSKHLGMEPNVLLMPPAECWMPLHSSQDAAMGEPPVPHSMGALMLPKFPWNDAALKWLDKHFVGKVPPFRHLLRDAFERLFALQVYFSVKDNDAAAKMVKSFMDGSCSGGMPRKHLTNVLREYIHSTHISDPSETNTWMLYSAFAQSLRLNLPAGVPGCPECAELSVFLRVLKLLTTTDCAAAVRSLQLVVDVFFLEGGEANAVMGEALRDDRAGQYFVAFVAANPEHWLPLVQQVCEPRKGNRSLCEELLISTARSMSVTPSHDGFAQDCASEMVTRARELNVLRRFTTNSLLVLGASSIFSLPTRSGSNGLQTVPIELFVDQCPAEVRAVLVGRTSPPETGGTRHRVRVLDAFQEWIEEVNTAISHYNCFVDRFQRDVCRNLLLNQQPIMLYRWHVFTPSLDDPVARAAKNLACPRGASVTNFIAALAMHSVVQVAPITIEVFSEPGLKMDLGAETKKEPLPICLAVETQVNTAVPRTLCFTQLTDDVAVKLLANSTACWYIRSSASELLRFVRDVVNVDGETIGGLIASTVRGNDNEKMSKGHAEAALLLNQLPLSCLLHILRLIP